MPRAATSKRAAPLRYDPLAVREPVAHKRDTRLARSQAPSLLALPSEILTDILSRVPWQTARPVCRTFAQTRPTPRLGVLQSEATRAVARAVRHVANFMIKSYDDHIRYITEHDGHRPLFTPPLVEWARRVRRNPIRSVADLNRALKSCGRNGIGVATIERTGYLALWPLRFPYPEWQISDHERRAATEFNTDDAYCAVHARLYWRPTDRLGCLSQQDLSTIMALHHCIPSTTLDDILSGLPALFSEDWPLPIRFVYDSAWSATVAAVRNGSPLPHTAIELDYTTGPNYSKHS